MVNIFSKYKSIFFLSNFILIIEYLYPGSLIGCIILNDCKIQPQITPDFIVSTNHLYSFLILSIIGFLTFKNSNKFILLYSYLILISFILEFVHYFIPNRSFEYPDLFGNLVGVVIIIIFNTILKTYENFKN